MEKQRDKSTGGSHLTKKKRKRARRLTGLQKVLVVIVVILAIALAGVLAFRSIFVKPELGDNKRPAHGDTQQEEIDWGDGTRPRADGARKSQDFYTILVVGRDTGGGGNTDTMLLASYDVTNQKAAVMSLPRDTMVNVPWDIKKLNSVYNFNGKGEKGIQALYKEVAQLVGFEPDYRVVVEWEAVGAIVDAIGGVWFDNPYPMDFHDPGQNLVIEQAPGYRLLSGEDAMQVIRWRGNDHDSPYGYRKTLYGGGGIGDTGRMKLQQDFLKAAMKQLLRPENVKNIGKIIKVFQENVETDLSFQNILWFGQQAVKGGLNPDTVEFFTMPYQGASCYSRTESKRQGKYYEVSYVVPKATELLDLVNHHLSPYQEVFTLSDLDIMSVNKDGSISSTTGHVEDAKAAVPPSKTPAKPAEQVAPEQPEEGETAVVDPESPVDPNAGTSSGTQTGGSTSPEGSVPEQPVAPPETKPQPKPEPKPEPNPEPQPEPNPQPVEPPAPVEPELPPDSGFVIIDPNQGA